MRKLLLLLALLMTAATGAWATDYTTLAVGDVIKVGDTFSPTAESEGAFNDSGVRSGETYTLMRADVDNEYNVTEKTDGAYYVFKFDSDMYPYKHFQKAFAVTAISDGLEVTNIKTVKGMLVYILAVHEPTGAPTGYTVSLNDGTENPTTWTASTDGTNFGALPIGGLKGDGSETVTLKYNGRLKVKSVTATSDAVPAGPVPVETITLNKTATEITVGQTETLSVTEVLPAEATNKTYTWKSSDTDKATVDQTGKVTAKANGTVNIYAEANDGSGVKGTCAVTVKAAPTLAQTMTTAGMTVKVKYYYDDEENYCLFSSVGNGTYTFQDGGGWTAEDADRAKALVVEGGKLVFKQNFMAPIENSWSDFGFSVTFDTSNNTYSQWLGGMNWYGPSFISVEVNGTTIAVTAAQ